MTSPHPRFESYVAACADALGLPAPTIENDSYMFQVGDRWVEMRFSPADERVTLACLIYMASPEEKVRADLVAQFNMRYLFDGGFTLVEPDGSGILYLTRPHRLASLDPRRARELLSDFARTAAMAGTWYIRTDEERPAPAAPAARPSGGETDGFIRV